MAISSSTLQKLVLLLRPFMESEKERRTYLLTALGIDTPVLHNLVWNTPTNIFIPDLVRELIVFGEISVDKPAICALLEVIRKDVGEDVKNNIDKLLQQIEEELNDSGTQIHTFPNTAIVRCVTFSPDGNLLVSGGEDRKVRIWNARSKELLYSFEHGGAVNCLAFSPDGKTLISGSDDKTIQVWRLNS